MNAPRDSINQSLVIMSDKFGELSEQIADLSNRVSLIETRGIESTLNALHKIGMLETLLGSFHEKIDSLLNKMEDLQQRGSVPTKLQEEKIKEMKKRLDETYKMAQSAKFGSIRSMANQAAWTAIVTVLLTALANHFFKIL